MVTKIAIVFPSAETRSWKSVACVSLVLCLSVVCGWSICMSTVGDSSHGLPVHRASIHVPLSMYVRVDVSPGIPLCRASQMYTIWPPTWTGCHVSYSVYITGPSALPGIPYTHTKASGIDLLPCVCRSLQWASRSVGLPNCIQYGLRHGPASMYLTVY